MRVLVVVVALAACSGAKDGGVDIDAPEDDDGPGPECSSVIGDPSQPIEVVPVRPDSGGLLDIGDGDSVGLMVPPQGGIILLVGGRARNLDGCAAEVTASLRDPGTGFIAGLEQRPSQLTGGSDGWGRPNEPHFYTLANVAVCPNAGATRDLFATPWELEVRISNGTRSGVARVTVTPSCDDTVAPDFCRCVCDADYQEGECGGGGPDSGVTDAGVD